MLTQYSQSARNQQDEQQLLKKTREFLSQIIAERHTTVSPEAIEDSVHPIVLIMQQILLSNLKTQRDTSGNTQNSHDKVKNILGSPRYSEVLAKRAMLQAKWESMDDSEEKRDISGLIFVDMQFLSNANLAILADDRELFVNAWAAEKASWGQLLELSCLAGARSIAEWIIEQQQSSLEVTDYENILGCISLSSNAEWTLDFARKMRSLDMTMPVSFYGICDDFDLTTQIRDVFGGSQKPVV